MERLTTRLDLGLDEYEQISFSNITDIQGMYNIIDVCDLVHENTVDGEWARKTLISLVEKFTEYEDLEITPDQVREMSRLYQEKCEEVVRLEKKLQNSVELSCKVGDKVYSMCKEFGILTFELDCFSSYENKIIFSGSAWSNGMDDTRECLDEIEFEASDIGKTVFLTREEAEKALNQCRNK